MEITFAPGYYEWMVYVGDRCVYAFQDVSDGLPYPCYLADVKYCVDDLITQMLMDISSGSVEIAYEERREIFANLKNLRIDMEIALFHNYGDAV